jgi:hypothetical protein
MLTAFRGIDSARKTRFPNVTSNCLQHLTTICLHHINALGQFHAGA